MSNELYHHGILGMKWGVRRFQNPDGTRTAAGKKRYQSTGLRSYIARKRNEKIDKSFQKWREGTQRKEEAINAGKNANQYRIQYETDRQNSEVKKQYRSANKQYKKALKSNTLYRRGSVREEVGHDMSRKYLSEAKKVESKLKNDPTNKSLQKEYARLMSKHDVARERARNAQAKAAKQSRAVANLRRARTIAIKGALATAAITAGAYAVNEMFVKTGKISREDIGNMFNFAEKGQAIVNAAKFAAPFFGI